MIRGGGGRHGWKGEKEGMGTGGREGRNGNGKERNMGGWNGKGNRWITVMAHHGIGMAEPHGGAAGQPAPHDPVPHRRSHAR